MARFFKNDPNYFPEIPNIVEEIEESSPWRVWDETEELITDTNGNVIVYKAKEEEEWFRCFIDGTYRIARTATYNGVPIYIASITAVMTERTKEKVLREVGLNKHLTVILFPFDAFSERFKNTWGDKIQEFKQYLKSEYNAISDCRLRSDSLDVLQKSGKNIWIYSDITYLGLRYEEVPRKRYDITEQNLFDEGKIYSRVRARVRVLMSVLEAANLKYYRENIERKKYKNHSESWVLVDGTVNNYWKFFCRKTNQSESYPLFNKVVGFIKTIRRTPAWMDIAQIHKLKEREFIVTIGTKNDEDPVVKHEMDEDKLEGENQWGFIYLRFRTPIYFPHGILSSRGIVKLQFRITEEYSEINVRDRILKIQNKAHKVASLAIKERFPLPTDKSRIWKEAVAIEETEKIAKSRLLSEEWLKNKGWTL